MRIFYSLDTNDDSKITFRDFNKSNLKDALFQVSVEEDINKVKDFFSYEHFYVIYCKFWELDSDHDFLLSKEDFSKYEGYTLCKKAVERIFMQIPRKFKSKMKDTMCFEDFLAFIISEEDKTTDIAIKYWFSILDLDQNYIIGPHEIEYFYEEQLTRLEFLNHEPILFGDILCQINDIFKPAKEGNYSIEILKSHREFCPLFFNSLINFNKFVAFEQRDVMAIKHDLLDNPNMNDWDRFVQTEYARLSMEDENNEDVVFSYLE